MRRWRSSGVVLATANVIAKVIAMRIEIVDEMRAASE